MKTLYQIQIVLGLILLVISSLIKADFREDGVKAHNKLRAKHKVPDLTPNSTLDKCAQDKVDDFAKNPDPSKYTGRNGKYGENMFFTNYSKVSDSLVVKMAVRLWYKEVSGYDYNNPEKPKGRTQEFTQIVWKNSKNIGIGVARSSRATYVSITYDPPGNIRESFPENVLKP